VIAAAGDIACDPADASFQGGDGTATRCRQKFTSDLLISMNPSAVLVLGDAQYECGSYQAFLQSYDRSWGRVKAITKPVIGNHEYAVSGGTGCSAANAGAAGYFGYFGAAAGAAGQAYYSYDIGAWHVIALNSNCGDAGGCDVGTPQYRWLQSDLAGHANQCLLAYWHIPLFSSGGRATNVTRPFWQLLYSAKADVVLNGHDHIYERFAQQDPSGKADPAGGIREFVVGTGGAFHTSIRAAGPMRNSQVRNTNSYGVLTLTLHPSSYEWEFVPEAGGSFTDAGANSCHYSAGANDTTPPTAPASLRASVSGTNTVNLVWQASEDDVGVVGYRVFRNGNAIDLTSNTSYSDTFVQADTQYSYAIVAYDAAGNVSPPSETTTVRTPQAAVRYRGYLALLRR
jgi:hypothetical protein